jgi:hypothetical protein
MHHPPFGRSVCVELKETVELRRLADTDMPFAKPVVAARYPDRIAAVGVGIARSSGAGRTAFAIGAFVLVAPGKAWEGRMRCKPGVEFVIDFTWQPIEKWQVEIRGYQFRRGTLPELPPRPWKVEVIESQYQPRMRLPIFSLSKTSDGCLRLAWPCTFQRVHGPFFSLRGLPDRRSPEAWALP